MDQILLISITVGVVISLILTVCGFVVLGAGIMILLDRTSQIGYLAHRLELVEEYLRDLSSEVNNAQESQGQAVFRSVDGKYSANTLEELIAKMSADPESGINADSAEGLNNFFEQLDNDEDDDDEKEDWKKRRKD